MENAATLPDATAVLPNRAFFMPPKEPYPDLPARPFFVLPLFREAAESFPPDWLEHPELFQHDPAGGTYVSVVYDTDDEFLDSDILQAEPPEQLIRLATQYKIFGFVAWKVPNDDDMETACRVLHAQVDDDERYDQALMWIPVLEMMQYVVQVARQSSSAAAASTQSVTASITVGYDEIEVWERQGFISSPASMSYWEEDEDGMSIPMRTLVADMESVSDAVRTFVAKRVNSSAFSESPVMPPPYFVFEENPSSELSLFVLNSNNIQDALAFDVGNDETTVDRLGMMTMEDIVLSNAGTYSKKGDVMFLMYSEEKDSPTATLVGFVELAMIKRYVFEISHLGVSRTVRGRRYGSRLMAMTLRLLRAFRKWDDSTETAREFYQLLTDHPEVVEAREVNATSPRFVQVQAHKNNGPAVKLYKRFGFFAPDELMGGASAINYVPGNEEDLQRELIPRDPPFFQFIKDLDDRKDVPVPPTRMLPYIARRSGNSSTQRSTARPPPARERLRARLRRSGDSSPVVSGGSSAPSSPVQKPESAPRKRNKRVIVEEDDDEEEQLPSLQPSLPPPPRRNKMVIVEEDDEEEQLPSLQPSLPPPPRRRRMMIVEDEDEEQPPALEAQLPPPSTRPARPNKMVIVEDDEDEQQEQQKQQVPGEERQPQTPVFQMRKIALTPYVDDDDDDQEAEEDVSREVRMEYDADDREPPIVISSDEEGQRSLVVISSDEDNDESDPDNNVISVGDDTWLGSREVEEFDYGDDEPAPQQQQQPASDADEMDPNDAYP